MNIMIFEWEQWDGKRRLVYDEFHHRYEIQRLRTLLKDSNDAEQWICDMAGSYINHIGEQMKILNTMTEIAAKLFTDTKWIKNSTIFRPLKDILIKAKKLERS